MDGWMDGWDGIGGGAWVWWPGATAELLAHRLLQVVGSAARYLSRGTARVPECPEQDLEWDCVDLKQGRQVQIGLYKPRDITTVHTGQSTAVRCWAI